MKKSKASKVHPRKHAIMVLRCLDVRLLNCSKTSMVSHSPTQAPQSSSFSLCARSPAVSCLLHGGGSRGGVNNHRCTFDGTWGRASTRPGSIGSQLTGAASLEITAFTLPAVNGQAL